MGHAVTNFNEPTNLRIVEEQVSNRKVLKFWNHARFIDELIKIKRSKATKANHVGKLLFSIGLFLSMVFVTMLFEWRSYEDAGLVELATSQQSFDELLEIPPTEQLPPPPPKTIQQPNIVEVQEIEDIKEELKIDFDLDIAADEVIEPVDMSTIGEIPNEEKAEEIFTIVENQPEPKMGMQGFYQYIYENIKYPRAAINTRVEGKVFIQFVVNSDGTLTDLEVIRGIGMGCDEEAIRVLKGAAPWSPGKQRGKPVRVRMVIPIHFKLDLH